HVPAHVDALDDALEEQVALDVAVLRYRGELGPQALDGLVEPHGPGCAGAFQQVPDVDRPHHPSSVSSGANSCRAGGTPRSLVRPASTWSIVLARYWPVAASSSEIRCRAASSCASFAST